MAYNKVLYAGTQAAYDALVTAGSASDSVLYFCTDSLKLYKGQKDFTASVRYAATKPETPVAGVVYVLGDTNTVEAYVNGAWHVISYPVNTALDDKATDAQVASAKSVVDYVTAQIAAATGSDAVVKAVKAGTEAGTIIVTDGAGTDATVTIPTVATSVATGTTAGSVAVKLTGADAAADVIVKDVVTKPTWDADERKLTLPVAGGEAVEVNIGKDMVVESGVYNHEKEEIVLTLANGAGTIVIPVAELIDEIVAGDTNTVDLTYTSATNTMTADVKISSNANNALYLNTTEGEVGLMVDLTAYATTESLNAATAALDAKITNNASSISANATAIANNASSIADLAAAIEWGTF